MTHQRKTRDEYDVEGNYGQGWETVTTEDTRAEAVLRLREYLKNEPGYPHRVKVHRVAREGQS